MKKGEIDDHVEELSALAMITMNGILSNRSMVSSTIDKFEAHKIAKVSYLVADYMLIEQKAIKERLTILADDE